jgi:predicted acylesterase/phospholipase RssA
VTKKKSAVSPTTSSETSTRDYQVPEDSSIRSIRYLTCEGGGVKGVGDVGAIEELERYGVLAQIEEVAGSSAGGLIATLLAIGCTPYEIREFMLELDFKAFQDKKEAGWSTQLQEVSQGVRELIGGIGKKSDEEQEAPKAGLLEKLEKLGDVGKLAFGKDLGIWEGDALRYCLAEMIARKTGNPNITFRELAALAGIEGSLYKKLTLTGTNLTDKIPEYYNVETTPDMPIVLAARISASFPGGFKPVIIEEKGVKKVKVDGGLLENIPDVFNKPPYVKPEDLTKVGGNPHAFALTFDASADRKPSKIKKGYHLLGALYNTKMSEEAQIKKYGDNIARIDTGDVGTLDFSLSMNRKQKLVESGAEAVRKSMQSILKKEAVLGIERYKDINIQELIRIETDLLFSIRALEVEKQKVPQSLIHKLDRIELEIERRHISDDKLKEYRKIAEKRYIKKAGILRSAANLTDEDLSKICEKKQIELLICEKELQEKIKDLELAKKSREFQRAIISDAFKAKGKKNKFAEEVLRLKTLEDNIRFLRRQLMLDGGKENSEYAEEYKAAKEKKNKKYEEIISFYEKTGDVALKDFFQELENDSKHPEFEMPYTVSEVFGYCSMDIETCDFHIEECARLSEDNKKLSELYHTQQREFLKKSDRSERYTTLIELKNSLDHSIHRNTSLLTRMNNYLVKKAPRFRKSISHFMQAVNVLAYISWVPLASPIGLIALACKKTSNNENTKKSADKILHYFNIINITADSKRRLFRDHTFSMIKKLDEDYSKINAAGFDDCIALQSKKMKELKLEFKDILIREPGENKKAYRKRVDEFNQTFNKLCQAEQISERGYALADETLDDFRKLVISDLQHLHSTKAHSNRTSHHQEMIEEFSSKRRQRADLNGVLKKPTSTMSFMRKPKSSATIKPAGVKAKDESLHGKFNRKYSGRKV